MAIPKPQGLGFFVPVGCDARPGPSRVKGKDPTLGSLGFIEDEGQIGHTVANLGGGQIGHVADLVLQRNFPTK